MSVNRIFGANSVNGTSAGALNDISKLALTDGDIAVAKDNTLDSIHFYRYDSASTEGADVYPTIIRPSDVVGAGVWYMISPQYFMENLIVEAGQKIIVNEIVGNGSGLSLGYQSGTVDIVVGTTEIAITKDITTDSQVTSTLVTGTAPFVVASTTLVDNLNVEFVGGEPRSNISLLDGTGDAFSAIPQVTDETTVVPSDPKDFTTVQYIDDLLATPSTISHGDLNDLLVDDHTQYSLVTGTRAYTGIPRVTDATTVFPSSTTHLTTKKYVDDEITALGLGGGGLYLLRSGANTATGILQYDAGVTPAGANDITDVEYVTGLISAHTGGSDPHTEYLLADATRVTLARLHTDVGDSLATTAHTDYTYIVRSDIDFWMEDAILTSGQSTTDVYTNTAGVSALSNIVRRDYAHTVADYSTSDIESNFHNLVTYGYLYNKLGGFIGAVEVVGAAIDVSVTSLGTGGFTAATNNLYSTTPDTATGAGLQVRAFIDENGDVDTITITTEGGAYTAGDTVFIVGGNNDTQLTIDRVFVEAGLHGDLNDLLGDDHTQYSLVDGSRAFTNPVSGVSSTSVGGDEDGELATRLWVIDYAAGVGPGTIDHDAGLLNVSSSTAHDNYMYVDPVSTPRGFTGVPYLDGTAFPDPATAIVNSNDLATKGYIDITIGNDFIKADGSIVLTNNQIYNPQIPHDYFLDKGDSSELINKDYVDDYAGLILITDTDEYMGYMAESFVPNNAIFPVINDGALTAVELNVDASLKQTLSRAVVVNGDGTTITYMTCDSTAADYPDTFPVWVDGAVSSTNITESTIIPLSNETNNGTGASLILTMTAAGPAALTAGTTTLDNAGYAFTAADDVALTGGTGTGAILHVLTVDARGAILTYDFSTGAGTGGAGYLLNDEMICPNASVVLANVRGDILGFEIIAQSGTLNNGTFPFEVKGDGTNSLWTVTVVGGSITQFDQTVVGAGYTNTGTAVSMTENDITGIISGTMEIQPFVHGEVLDVSIPEQGFGYTSALYTYTDIGPNPAFTEAGYNVGGGTSTIDIDFINPLDERVEVMHYNKGELDSNVVAAINPYVVSAGNTVSSITFDDWGHITDIAQAGVAPGVWEEKSANFTAEYNKSYFVDVNGAAKTVTFPVAAPTVGQTIVIDDYTKAAATYNITCQGNGGANTLLVEGVASQDIVIDVSSSRVTMTYVDGTYGWRIKVY